MTEAKTPSPILIVEEEIDDPDYPDCHFVFQVTQGPGKESCGFPYSDSAEWRDQLKNARELAAKWSKQTGNPVKEVLISAA